MKKAYIISVLVLLTLFGCGRNNGKKEPAAGTLRSFPMPEVPAMLETSQQKQDYLMAHFWDGFFAGDGQCDTSAVLGVATADVEKNLAAFIQMLDMFPMEKAQTYVATLFDKVEAKQAADTSSHVYLLMRDMVSKYLYDPNSPYRNEDYYLPFVEGLARSPMTPENVRPGYVYEARMCSMNRYGTQAPDFSFKDGSGRIHRLYDVKAGNIVLFFSNPGCPACKEIIETLTSRPYMEPMVKSGKIAIVNIYIDEEIDKWKDYLPNYPEYWICGYDYRTIIREDEIYNVRAIPSLYVLDSEKRIMLRDAPTEKVLTYLDNKVSE